MSRGTGRIIGCRHDADGSYFSAFEKLRLSELKLGRMEGHPNISYTHMNDHH